MFNFLSRTSLKCSAVATGLITSLSMLSFSSQVRNDHKAHPYHHSKAFLKKIPKSVSACLFGFVLLKDIYLGASCPSRWIYEN